MYDYTISYLIRHPLPGLPRKPQAPVTSGTLSFSTCTFMRPMALRT